VAGLIFGKYVHDADWPLNGSGDCRDIQEVYADSRVPAPLAEN